MLATDALEHLPLPADVPVSLDLSPDGRVLGFTLLVALVTGLTCGWIGTGRQLGWALSSATSALSRPR